MGRMEGMRALPPCGRCFAAAVGVSRLRGPFALGFDALQQNSGGFAPGEPVQKLDGLFHSDFDSRGCAGDAESEAKIHQA